MVIPAPTSDPRTTSRMVWILISRREWLTITAMVMLSSEMSGSPVFSETAVAMEKATAA